MLLDLFAARLEGGRVSVTSACLASGAATSTALDWITKLEQMGLLARLPDLNDRRRTHLEISQEAADAVARWLMTAFGDDYQS